MSARIVVNLEPALASSAIDRGPDGGTWLSVWGDKEVVMVKLSAQSLRALWFALSKELATLPGGATAPPGASESAAAAGIPSLRDEARPVPPAAPRTPATPSDGRDLGAPDVASSRSAPASGDPA